MSAQSTYPPGQPPPGGLPTSPLTYLQGAPVSFGEAIRQALRNGFIFRGRASRSAYWWFALFLGIVIVALQFIVIARLAGNGGGSASPPVVFIILAPVWGYLGLTGFALWVRRLHDTGRSGWSILMGLVPFVGAIMLLTFALIEGDPGPN
jgi:uncharacterized membrane protein YhaH (DUF805 family)